MNLAVMLVVGLMASVLSVPRRRLMEVSSVRLVIRIIRMAIRLAFVMVSSQKLVRPMSGVTNPIRFLVGVMPMETNLRRRRSLLRSLLMEERLTPKRNHASVDTAGAKDILRLLALRLKKISLRLMRSKR